MMGLSLPSVEYVFGQKLPHVREHVKISHIAKVCLSWEVYKPCPLLSQGVLRERELGIPFRCTRIWTIVPHVRSVLSFPPTFQCVFGEWDWAHKLLHRSYGLDFELVNQAMWWESKAIEWQSSKKMSTLILLTIRSHPHTRVVNFF
jgi:hypothetical protein